jgi:hypothetical protein
MRKKIAPIALGLALAVAAQGCYGKFQLTKNLHKWNGSLGNKAVVEVVFLAIGVILPVYSIAVLIDGVILNSVEFWSGKNPMASRTVTDGDKQAMMNYDKATGIVAVKVFDKGVMVSETFLKKDGDRILTLDKSGKVLFTASADMNGVASVADAKGMIIAQSAQQ